jgi:SpoIIAA-like
MSANLELEPNDVCVLRISGKLQRSEFGVAREAMAQTIDAGAKPHLLAILDKFEGWERGADWNDLDFLFFHSHQIARIAIVVDPRWEVPALAFAGTGVRRAPVKLFPPNELAQARQWLAG